MEQPKINLLDLPDITCPKCESLYFIPASRYKILSKLVTQSGKEELYPIEVLACTQCGYIIDSVKDAADKLKKTEGKSNIIKPDEAKKPV